MNQFHHLGGSKNNSNLEVPKGPTELYWSGIEKYRIHDSNLIVPCGVPAFPDNDCDGPARPTDNASDGPEKIKSIQSAVLALIPMAPESVLRKVLYLLKNPQISSQVHVENSNTEPASDYGCLPGDLGSEQRNPALEGTTMSFPWLQSHDLGLESQSEWMPTVRSDIPIISNDTSDDTMSWEPSRLRTMSQTAVELANASSIAIPTAQDSMPYNSLDLHNVPISGAVTLTRYLIDPGRLNSNRNSTQSSISYDSTQTGWSTSSKHSSITSVGSQSTQSFRPSLRETMSSGGKKLHRRSTSSSGPSNVPCTEPGCTVTFTRSSDRDRHIDAKHDNIMYKCLLHTCTYRCTANCQDPQHSQPVPRARRDKVRKHLEQVHGWNITSKDVPESWLWSYIWGRTGWSCRSCGVFLGSWADNRSGFSHHTKDCTQGLPNLIKRLSMEEKDRDQFRSSGSGNGHGKDQDKVVATFYAGEEDDEDEDSQDRLFG